MPSEGAPPVTSVIPQGTYVPSGPSDKRSPCPLVNSLANHGYIARDGRNIQASELNAAVNRVGISMAMAAAFSHSVYNVHQEPNTANLQKQMGFLRRLWSIFRNPWSILSKFGVRRLDQKNGAGQPVIDLDQLALPGAIEHDVSLTRRDHPQKEGNCAPQADLIDGLLACSKDDKILTIEDMAAYRKRRIQQQRDDNPDLLYEKNQHHMACAEIALALNVFGDGKSIPYDYAHAFFKEERLPIKEGWKKRWWTLGFLELERSVSKIKALVGMQI